VIVPSQSALIFKMSADLETTHFSPTFGRLLYPEKRFPLTLKQALQAAGPY